MDSVDEANLATTAAKNSKRNRIEQCLCPFEIPDGLPARRFSRHCSPRAMMCTVGGMLAIVMVQQPGKVLVTYKSPHSSMLSHSIGHVYVEEEGSTKNSLHNDDVSTDQGTCGTQCILCPLQYCKHLLAGGTVSVRSSNVSLSQSSGTPSWGDTVLLLCDGVIQMYSLKKGCVVYQLSAHRVPIDLNEDDLAKGLTSDPLVVTRAMKESTSYKSLRGTVVPLDQGAPCTVYYSQYSEHVIVGYSDGNVSLLTVDVPPIGESGSGAGVKVFLAPSHCYRLDTSASHSAPITVLTTIQRESPDAVDSMTVLNSVWLVVGDNNGVLSVWKILHKNSSRANTGATECMSVVAHRSAVNRIEVLRVAHSNADRNSSNGGVRIGHNIILSSDVSGEIKAWSLCSVTGQLLHVGVLNTHSKLSTIGAVIMNYVEDPISKEMRESYPTEDKKRRSKPSADDFNIVCVSGHVNGKISSWIFSSNPSLATENALSTMHPHTGSVIAIDKLGNHVIPSALSLLGDKRATSIERLMLSAASDGSCCLFGLTACAKILPLHRYYSSGPTRAVVVSSDAGINGLSTSSEVEVFQINESSVTSFIATTPRFSTAIPKRWRDRVHYRGMLVHSIPDQRSRPASASSRTSASSKSLVFPAGSSVSSSMPSIRIDWNDDLGLQPEIYDAEVSPLDTPLSCKSSDVSIGPMKGMKIGHLSLKNLKEMTTREIWKADNNRDFECRHPSDADGELLDDARPGELPQPVASGVNSTTWNLTLGVQTELQLAKKDGTLLEMFRQNCVESKFPAEVVTARDAASVLDRWMAKIIENNSTGDSITKKQVLDIFSILNVKDGDFLDFIKVAKLGAVLSSMYKNASKPDQPFMQHGRYTSKNRISKRFSEMKTSTKVVTYNSMGERVVTTVPFSDKAVFGIPDGYADTIRKIWKRESPRVPYHVNGAAIIAPDKHDILVRELPSHIVPLVYKRTKLPKVWSSKLDHYFDVRRTIRVARTILDMRQGIQHDFLLKERKDGFVPPPIPRMTDLALRYFEHNYGGGDMNIAHTKFVHFLEAICQYSEYSVLNCMRFFIFSEEHIETQAALTSITKYEWLYLESRRWLMTTCSLVNGGDVTGLQNLQVDAGSFLEPSVTSISSVAGVATSLNWQLVRRNDALVCVDEMLRKRGGYGPGVVDDMLAVVNNVLPPVSPVTEFASAGYEDGVVESDYVDMEQFLEAFTFELRKLDHEISDIRADVFGSNAVPRQTIRSSHGPRHITGVEIGKVSVQESDAVALQRVMEALTEVQAMMQRFMTHDPLRTGFVSSDLFRSVLLESLRVQQKDDESLSEQFREEDNKEVVVRQSIIRFSSGEGSDSIGYVDFLAVCIAWLLQCDEVIRGLHSSWILEAFASLRRGLERTQGKSLLQFLFRAQAYRGQTDTYWMARHKSIDAPSSSVYVIDPLRDASLSYSSVLSLPNKFASSVSGESTRPAGTISYEGEWSVLGNIPAANDPGLITVKRIEPKPVVGSGEAALGVDGSEWKNRTKKNVDSNLHIKPAVRDTSRTMTNLHGESYREHYVAPTAHDPADIAPKELSVDASLDIDFTATATCQQSSTFAPGGSQIIDGIRFDETTFTASHALQMSMDSTSETDNILVASKSVSLHIPSDVLLDINRKDSIATHNDSTSLASLDNVGENSHLSRRDEIDSYRNSEKFRREEGIRRMQARTHTAIETARSKRENRDAFSASGSLALGRGNVTDVLRMHSRTADIYPDGFEESATDDALQEYAEMRKMEEEMYMEIEDMELKLQLKMHQKYLADRNKRRLAKRKEMESLKLKQAADDERMRRREEARKLEEKARLAEEADKAAKEEEVRKKQAAIREARNEADRLRKEKEMKEAEVHREMLELQAMRREERVSAAYEQAVKDKLAR